MKKYSAGPRSGKGRSAYRLWAHDLKIHAKMSAVVRRESGRLVTYTHPGTGLYHPITAKVYTDLSYFTCDKNVGRDVYEVFKYLTSHVHPEKLKKSFISPYQSMPRLSSLIDAEIVASGQGKPSGIWIKMQRNCR